MILPVPKTGGNFLTENRVASQTGLCSMQLALPLQQISGTWRELLNIEYNNPVFIVCFVIA